MKISTLIKELNSILTTHGDLKVVLNTSFKDSDEGWCPLDDDVVKVKKSKRLPLCEIVGEWSRD